MKLVKRETERKEREKNIKGKCSHHSSPPMHQGDFLAAKSVISNFLQRSAQSTPLSFHYKVVESNENDTLRPHTAIMLTCKSTHTYCTYAQAK